MSLTDLAPTALRLLWQQQTTGSTMSWDLDPLGQVTDRAVLPNPAPAANWQLAGTGDFDRDGTVDQLWRQRLTGENQLWLSQNADQFNPGAPTIVNLPQVIDRQWQIAGVADFNGDRQLDILWRHQVRGTNQIWLMNGLKPQTIANVPAQSDRAWKIGGIADFNHDGQADILWRHQTSGANQVWLMQGSTISDRWNLPELVDPNWQISGVGDLNQDGQTDLLWWHEPSGKNQAWLMQGQQRRQSLTLESTPDPSWRLAAVVSDRPAVIGPTTGTPKIQPAAAADPLAAPPPSPFSQPDPSTLPKIELAIQDLRLRSPVTPITAVSPVTPVIPAPVTPATPTISLTAPLPITVKFTHQGTATDRVKLSFFLSEDATIDRRDRFLQAVSVTVLPNQVNQVEQTIQLPSIGDEFWQQAMPDGKARTFYFGVTIEGLYTAPEADRSDNARALLLQFQPPLLQSYDFVYDYSGVTDFTPTVNPPKPISDFYRGTVIAPSGTYTVGQSVDPLADRNQAGTNGRYQITAAQPYSGTQKSGWVEVSEYFDRETAQRYQPVGADGATGLGSESGYIRPQQSNTDYFGYDFYVADRYLTAPVAPIVGVADHSPNAITQSLLNPFGSYWDTRQNGGIITYSFYQDTGVPYAGPEIVATVSEGIKRNVRQIFSALERSIAVRFVEVIETATSVGAIRYLLSNGEGDPFYAYTYYPGPTIGGDVHLSAANADQAETGFAAAPGSYGYRSLLHETLHALGLKHPGNYDAGAGASPGPFLTAATDNSTNTIMSYNTAGVNEITPMAYDRQALQYLYGAPATSTAATTYRFETLTHYHVGQAGFGDVNQSTKQSIWDGGGEDTLDFSGLTIVRDHRFDLRPGGILTAQMAYNNQTYRDRATQKQFFTSEYGVTLSNTTLIENFVNSSGNDFVIANGAANQFRGYRLGRRSGNDVIAQATIADQIQLEDYALADLQVAVSDDTLLIRLAGDGSLRLLDYFQQPIDIRLNGQSYRYDRQIGWVAKTSTVTTA